MFGTEYIINIADFSVILQTHTHTHTHRRICMNTSGYEIRHALLNESKEMLFERWHMEMDVERICAERENRSPVVLPYPTVEDIKRTAENLYEFVQNR